MATDKLIQWFDGKINYSSIKWDDPDDIEAAMKQAVRDNPGGREPATALRMTRGFINSGEYQRHSEGVVDYFKGAANRYSLEELQRIKSAQGGTFAASREIDAAIESKTRAVESAAKIEEEQVSKIPTAKRKALQQAASSSSPAVQQAAEAEIARRDSQINNLYSDLRGLPQSAENIQDEFYKDNNLIGDVPTSITAVPELRDRFGYTESDARRASEILRNLKKIDAEWRKQV